MAQSNGLDPQAPRMSLSVLVATALLLVSSALPVSAGSVPDLIVGKMSIKLNFSKSGNDSIGLQGTLAVPDGFRVEGRKFVLDVGGVIKSFTLDAKGKAKAPGEQLVLKVKAKKGVVTAQDAKLSLKLTKGTFSADLADDGLVNETVKAVPVFIPVTVTVDDNPTPPTATAQLSYTAKKGKTGSAK